jgi:beta-mannosidase
MGSLYWQLNDLWPGVTWSSIDSDGRWKALQFRARHFYAPLLIAALRHAGTTTVSLVSDRTTSLAARWRLRLMDFAGKVRREEAHDVTLAPLAGTRVARYTDAQLLDGADPRATFAVFELVAEGKLLSRDLVFFALPKDLRLPQPRIHAQLAPAAAGYRLTLATDALARDVWVSFGDIDAGLSDNGFNLLPGEPVTLDVASKASAEALRQALQVRDLAHAMGTPP